MMIPKASMAHPAADPSAYLAWQRLWQEPSAFPVRFTYDGRPYRGLGGLPLLESRAEHAPEKETVEWKLALDKNVTLRVSAAFWPQWGAREWTLWFENTGTENSAVLEQVLALDETFLGVQPTVRGIRGDYPLKYAPYCLSLADAPAEFRSDSGRPTHGEFPYFDLVCGDGGCFVALGWAGTWQARFEAVEGGARVTGSGTNGFAAYLKPGERVRTALVALLPYRGRDAAAAANLWRGWFVACNLPRADASGRPLQPFSTCCLASDTGRPNSDGSISEDSTTWRPSLERMAQEGVHVDVRWFDAGWYSDPRGRTVPELWWHTVGSWELDRHKWPGDSFLQSTQYARDHQMQTMVWFEPERVTDPEGLAENYGYDPSWALQVEGVYTNNIGNPDCLTWTTGRILQFLEKHKVEIYREDNNSDSAASWRRGDELEGPGRSGITENRAVAGHYALWDAIIAFEAAHGGATFIDSCAGGGGRNDLESMRRGVPLLRSDSDRTSTALRLSMTSSFNAWLPFCGSCTVEKVGQLDTDGVRDMYVWRASYLPALNVNACWSQRPDTDFEMVRAGIREWETVRPYLLKDFYALTPWHSQEDRTGWTAWAWFDPQTGKGVLQAFRMEDCPDARCTLRLPFAGARQLCRLRDADTGEVHIQTGEPFTLTLQQPRSAALLYLELL